jgi:cell division initiation protein
MRITPLEIRQKSFEKKLRGYDKDEVNAFLLTLSQVWEQVMEDNKELKINNENAQREIKQLREVENSLFKTLKTAEDTGANIMDQANKAAELHLRETQMSADVLLNEAKSKARSLIEEADDRSTHILEGLESEVKSIAQVYRNLENHRDNLLVELQNLSNDTLRRVEKLGHNDSGFNLDSYLNEVRQQISQSSLSNSAQASKKAPPKPKAEVKKAVEVKKDTPDTPEVKDVPVENDQEGSFFDRLD